MSFVYAAQLVTWLLRSKTSHARS